MITPIVFQNKGGIASYLLDIAVPNYSSVEVITITITSNELIPKTLVKNLENFGLDKNTYIDTQNS